MWGAGGLLGGRLTADLVLRSPQGMNCLGDYELCLRGARAKRTLESCIGSIPS